MRARPNLLFISSVLAIAACSQRVSSGTTPSVPPSPFLFVWTNDADSVDLNYLAVVDAREDAATYGDVITTLAVPTSGRIRGHHTEHMMPSSGTLFANDFGTGKTYLIDLRDPSHPALADSFAAAGDLTFPHSFERMPNGNVLATFQTTGQGNTAPGGIAELDARGHRVRSGSAASGDLFIRPYSLAIVPSLDRVVTGSVDMRMAGDSRVVQVWRLSDLTLVRTIMIPNDWGSAAEPRVLADGRTVLVSTFGCALLRIVDLEGSNPRAELVYRFKGASCAVPVVAGHYWIQTVPAENALIALDVQRPEAPREVGRVVLGAAHWPHWISIEPNGKRIVITGYQATRHRVIIVKLDQSTGALSLDAKFGAGSGGPGISFNRPNWPHGATGPGDPHGAVFSQPQRNR